MRPIEDQVSGNITVSDCRRRGFGGAGYAIMALGHIDCSYPSGNTITGHDTSLLTSSHLVFFMILSKCHV